jgi:hypothetical protein
MTYLALDCFRCNGETLERIIDSALETDIQPLCTHCLRYLRREDYGPRTPFMQGRFIGGGCVDYLEDK